MPYYEIEVVDQNTYRIWIRWGRPSFWLEGYRTMREAGNSVWESVYWTAALVLELAKRRRH